MVDDSDNLRRVVRYIKPLGPRVLVRVVKLEERSASGLYLPEGVKEEHDDALYGEVIEVARAENDAEEPSLGENVSGVPLGAFVLFPKKEGLRVPWDENLRLLLVKNVVAVVEEVEANALQ
ncbi:MAG: co-chaperone GroES family protein [Myxococcota bacterium]|nr:co-chaperone GroES family protein [Myxococcota bacterium]